MEEFVKSLGFESESEFHTLNATLDISNPYARLQYLHWRDNDGTKTGLVALINKWKKD